MNERLRGTSSEHVVLACTRCGQRFRRLASNLRANVAQGQRGAYCGPVCARLARQEQNRAGGQRRRGQRSSSSSD